MDAVDPLLLYREAVQAPAAEVQFLSRAWAHAHPGWSPTRLREDFAGTAAVAAAWVALSDDHRAVAVEHDPVVCRRAAELAQDTLGPRAEDLLLVEDDVRTAQTPAVQVVAALNFSALGFHDASTMGDYLQAAAAILEPGGVLVLDLFGGPAAERSSAQSRPITDGPAEGWTYTWRQVSFDPATRRIRCAIDFTSPDGERMTDAFEYDWRLWPPTELVALAVDHGFADAEIWCDRWDPRAGRSVGRHQPVDPSELERDDRPDWAAYLVCRT